MIDIGNFSASASWLLTLYAFLVGGYGAWKLSPKYTQSAKNALIVGAILGILSLIVLGVYFLQHDYRYLYVWRTSNNEMHWVYLVSAIWGGMDGSMLLWAAMVGIFGMIAVLRTGPKAPTLIPWATVVFAGVMNYFLFVTVFLTNPFRLIPADTPIPLDGRGLNPLLQNPSMLIHPITLYLGFTGLTVPFAFCMAALLSGQLGTEWIRLTRRWTLVSWGFLTAGIILGGNWAYIELGWGGFWAWDPVENASFLPWLTATAYLHSVMVQERRGMLKVWNVVLCSLTYLLTVFGTFLTRSGIVQSVHAFAETDVGWVFILFMIITTAATAALIALRYKELRPESTMESYLSREAIFLFNNLILLAICFATFWGVMYPVISEAVTGTKSVVGPPFFNAVNVPLFLILLLMMGIGPLVAWRRSSLKALGKIFVKPLIFGSLVTVLCFTLDPSRLLAGVSFGLSAFVLGTILGEFTRAMRIQRELVSGGHASALISVFRRRPERYGAYLIHLGVVLAAIAITASMVYKTEKDFSLGLGERYEIGRYSLELANLREADVGNYIVLHADVNIYSRTSGDLLGSLHPERRFYKASQQPTTEVDIRMTALEDLYIAIGGLDTAPGNNVPLQQAKAVFKVFINPLQLWLWVASFVILFGTLMVIRPQLREAVALSVPHQKTLAQKGKA